MPNMAIFLLLLFLISPGVALWAYNCGDRSRAAVQEVLVGGPTPMAGCKEGALWRLRKFLT